jgi:hypothetical protein
MMIVGEANEVRQLDADVLRTSNERGIGSERLAAEVF